MVKKKSSRHSRLRRPKKVENFSKHAREVLSPERVARAKNRAQKEIREIQRTKHPVFIRLTKKLPVKYSVMIPYAHYNYCEVRATSRTEAIELAQKGLAEFKGQLANPDWSRRIRVRKI